MCSVLSKTHFSTVHLFVSVRNELAQHAGTITNSNATFCKLYSNYKSYLGSLNNGHMHNDDVFVYFFETKQK